MIILPKNLLQVTPAIKNCIIIGFSLVKHHLEFDLTNGEISTPHLINLTPAGWLVFFEIDLKIDCPTKSRKIRSQFEILLSYS